MLLVRTVSDGMGSQVFQDISLFIFCLWRVFSPVSTQHTPPPIIFTTLPCQLVLSVHTRQRTSPTSLASLFMYPINHSASHFLDLADVLPTP
jgi:hypothetical protein